MVAPLFGQAAPQVHIQNHQVETHSPPLGFGGATVGGQHNVRPTYVEPDMPPVSPEAIEAFQQTPGQQMNEAFGVIAPLSPALGAMDTISTTGSQVLEGDWTGAAANVVPVPVPNRWVQRPGDFIQPRQPAHAPPPANFPPVNQNPANTAPNTPHRTHPYPPPNYAPPAFEGAPRPSPQQANPEQLWVDTNSRISPRDPMAAGEMEARLYQNVGTGQQAVVKSPHRYRPGDGQYQTNRERREVVQGIVEGTQQAQDAGIPVVPVERTGPSSIRQEYIQGTPFHHLDPVAQERAKSEFYGWGADAMEKADQHGSDLNQRLDQTNPNNMMYRRDGRLADPRNFDPVSSTPYQSSWDDEW